MSGNKLEYEGISIEWLGHASVRIKAKDKVIYVDPYEIEEGEKADLVLITHEHYDHCSIVDVKKIQKENTIILAAGSCGSQLEGNVQFINPNKETECNGIKIETVNAYNVDKDFHPKEKNGVGFIIELNGKRIYHAGDTDLIPEMNAIEDVDIALLPIGGTYTMDALEAAQAANIIEPEIAIPIHYGKICGKISDAEVFKKNCDVKVEILTC